MKIATRAGASRGGDAQRFLRTRRARGRRIRSSTVGALDKKPQQGPLIIEEFDATIVVPPDARVHKDAIGCIVLEFEA